MTSMLGVALTAVFLAAVAPAPAAPERFQPCGHEATGTARLHTGPGASRPSLGLLRAGDELTVLRESGDWYRVSLDRRSRSGLRADTAGWAAKRHVRPLACPRPNG
ncbi:SH3 domain-containing protein [Streptomyces sp. NRRL F-5727]|uniref:SH3 domain-containing protein n=1 Tax=Streptomyces sp. NRRL F-5727 TaxID=1463871 RepID=UPI00131E4A17|nr:SH3 domain-containing protein [Streptomyces sp. NRRL F-5727]